MKKTVLFSVMLAGAATCLAGSSTVSSANAIGLMEVADNSKDYLLVAVPWLDYGTGDAAINVADLIKTANLTAGDKLYVSDGSYYDTYVLQNNEWVPTKKASVSAAGVVTEDESTPASTRTVQRGDAIWLKRSAKNTFYIFGQKPDSDTVTVNLSAGMNLVASPSATGLKLSSFSTGCIANDEIIVSGNSGEEAHYYFREPSAGGGVACWCKVQKSGIRKSYVAATETITAGTGFWYKTTGTGRSITL